MATNDVITVSEAASFLGIADTTQDDRLSLYVSAISARLDEGCGPIVKRQVVDVLDGHASRLYLSAGPVVEVESVSVWDGSESTDLDPADYRMDAAGRLERIRSLFPCEVTVTYEAGRFDSTEDVAPVFKTAALVMLKNVWRMEQTSVAPFGEYDVPTQSFPTFAVPRAAKELLRGEWRVNPGFA